MGTDWEDLSAHRQWRADYESDGLLLQGYLFEGARDEPKPGIVFSHGSEGLLSEQLVALRRLADLGYVCYAAVRRGFNTNPGRLYMEELTVEWGDAGFDADLVRGLSLDADDVLAALSWLARRPGVDSSRIALVGHSFGAVVSLLASQDKHASAIRSVVSFAGPSITWPIAPRLQDELRMAASRIKVPVFLAQAANDNSLAPTYALGTEFARIGADHEVRIYEALGADKADGHALFARGQHLWLEDVRRFLTRTVQRLTLDGGFAHQRLRAGVEVANVSPDKRTGLRASA
jgi:dienelactone hydrolase